MLNHSHAEEVDDPFVLWVLKFQESKSGNLELSCLHLSNLSGISQHRKEKEWLLAPFSAFNLEQIEEITLTNDEVAKFGVPQGTTYTQITATVAKDNKDDKFADVRVVNWI